MNSESVPTDDAEVRRQRSAAARFLNAQRRRVAGVCHTCGKPIEGIVTKRYCSARCRFHAAYLRRTFASDESEIEEEPSP